MLSKFAAFRADAVPRGTHDGRSHVEGVPDELAIEIDKDGSPISTAPATWFICFVPGLQKQWWHRFVNAKHKHVFAIRMVNEGKWILIEPWWTRMMCSVLGLEEAVKFLRWGASGSILAVREAIPGKGSQARGWSNCAVLMSFLLGRSYWTWTPHGLYRRLAAEPDTKPVDLDRFLFQLFRDEASRNADEALKSLRVRDGESLRATLMHLGSGIMTAMFTPSALGLYKVAVSEAARFRDAADEYWLNAPGRAIELLEGALKSRRWAGKLDVTDHRVAARQFIAMLRGDLYLEVVFGLSEAPTPSEVHARVQSVVNIFLAGACSKSTNTNASALP